MRAAIRRLRSEEQLRKKNVYIISIYIFYCAILFAHWSGLKTIPTGSPLHVNTGIVFPLMNIPEGIIKFPLVNTPNLYTRPHPPPLHTHTHTHIHTHIHV
jgi:hypothetical protein